MRNKSYSILLISILVLGISSGVLMFLVIPTVSSESTLSLPTRCPTDLTPKDLGYEEMAIRKKAAEVGSAEATQASPIGEPAEVGDEFTFPLSDSYLGVSYDEDFIVLIEGAHCLILITKDAYDSYDGVEYHYANPYGTWDHYWDNMTLAQFQYLADEFDNVIYPTVTDTFGEPLPRGDEGQKVWALIFNIRSASYYDDTATSYTVGYFSAAISGEFNKNVMHIDTYDWENSLGPGTDHLMEAVFAHEFEHLVHFDQDPDEPSWVDEGCADLAEYLCGYGEAMDSHIAYYIVFHWATALTFWGNGLEDYGASYLFALYLLEQFGVDFIKDLVQEQANGIEGIQKTLYKRGHFIHFDTIFDRWTIANYLDDPSKGDGWYGYNTLDIPSAMSWGWSIDDALTFFYGEPIFEADFALGSWWWNDPQPYTAQYFRFTNRLATIYFDASDFSGTLPYSGDYEWYSGAMAWSWRSFHQTFDIPAGGATLNFNTFYEIELDWDYGYVEVYDYDTDEYTTLEAPGITVSTDPFSQDNPNVPDGREPKDYLAAGKWHAFTGSSGGWIPVSMDLSPFAGHQIELHFRLWQDGAFTLQNMYVDDIAIPELGFSDDVESGEGNWETDGWYITDGIWDNDYEMTVLTVRYGLGPNPDYLWESHYHISYATQSFSGTTERTYNNFHVMIISNRADHILTSAYEF
ncbi:MAG: hypothetical protein ACXACC_00425 [Promethearchaeota archaeon]|jgi:hypothetical protein